jgi:RND family efflux transporter MFP subunit
MMSATLAFVSLCTLAQHTAGAVLEPVEPRMLDAAPVGGVDSSRVLGVRGVARPWRRVTLAAPRDGLLTSVRVVEGAPVTEGSVVAALDRRVAEASVRAAEAEAARIAEVLIAESELEDARSRARRIAQLARGLGTNEAEIEGARLRLEEARARLLAAHESSTRAAFSLEVERARLDDHLIRAPFDGVVTRVVAERGSVLSLAEPVIEVVQLDSLRVELHVPVGSTETLEIGRPYLLEGETPAETTLVGWLRAAPPVLDPATRTLRCVFEVDNRIEKLPSGFIASIVLDERGLPVPVETDDLVEPIAGKPATPTPGLNAGPRDTLVHGPPAPVPADGPVRPREIVTVPIE